MPNKIQYTYDEMRGDLLDIVRQMTADDFRPHAIVGIARGGLVAATMLSHYFEVPLITLNLSLRDNMVDGMVDFATLRAQLLGDHKLVLVDDICDSGATFAKVDQELRTAKNKVDGAHMENLKTVALWHNTAQDLFEPNYVGREINKADDPSWIIFPYEEWWKA